MFEHWQYVALGALSMTPILGVFWSVARGWRLKADASDAEYKKLKAKRTPSLSDALEVKKTADRLADQVIELTIKLQDESALTADQSDRLNRIIARGKTKNPNSTVKAMVRIAEGG